MWCLNLAALLVVGCFIVFPEVLWGYKVGMGRDDLVIIHPSFFSQLSFIPLLIFELFIH